MNHTDELNASLELAKLITSLLKTQNDDQIDQLLVDALGSQHPLVRMAAADTITMRLASIFEQMNR